MTPAIELDQLSKFFGDFAALRSVNLAVNPGEIFGLLGPNGAGKTTTFRLLMGILQPTAGSARVAGVDCHGGSLATKRRLGYLSDDSAPYDFLTGREILEFVAEMHGLSRAMAREEARRLMDEWQLLDVADEFATDYSAGMKKKLALACALIHRPDILLLDEPTNSLDPAASKHLRQWIVATAAQGKTIILSTHMVDLAERICSRIGILAAGRLLAVGSPAHLVERFCSGGRLEDVYMRLTQETHHPGD